MPRQNIIMCAVDGSEASKTVVEWAAGTTVKCGEPLHLVSSYSMPQFLYARGVVPPQKLYDDLKTETLEKISEAKKIALGFAPSADISHQIEEGNPIDMLLDLSRQTAMVVMGSHGLGGLSGMVMGSVSAAVVSHASCPVVVVREDNLVTDETEYSLVVVGVDDSDISEKTTEYAFREADARGTELIAVHAWVGMQVQASPAGLPATQSQWQVMGEERKALLGHRLGKYAKKYPEVAIKKVVTRDRPVRALTGVSEGSQLLVVGSHGRGGFKGMLFGSTSHALLQAAAYPMMVIRPETDV